MKGWVYVISNKAMDGIIKVGHSTKDPELRAQELNHTGSPHPYVVEYEMLIEEPYRVEQAVHKVLYQFLEGKEWFRCTPEQAVAAIKQVAGDKQILENFKRTNRQKAEELRIEKEKQEKQKVLSEEKEQQIIDKHDKIIKCATENNLSTAYNNRGVEFTDNELYDRAIEDFNKAIALNLNCVNAYYYRGLAYKNTGQLDSAISDFKKACDLGYKDACGALQELKIIVWLVAEFKKDQGIEIDLSKDKMALQRFKHAAEEAKIKLFQSIMNTEINLPFITVDATGPKHIVISLSRAKLEQITDG